MIVQDDPDGSPEAGAGPVPAASAKGLKKLTIPHPERDNSGIINAPEWSYTTIDLESGTTRRTSVSEFMDAAQKTPHPLNQVYENADLLYASEGNSLVERLPPGVVMLRSAHSDIRVGWIPSGAPVPDAEACTAKAQSRTGFLADSRGIRSQLHRAWCQTTAEGHVAFVRVDEITPQQDRRDHVLGLRRHDLLQGLLTAHHRHRSARTMASATDTGHSVLYPTEAEFCWV